MYPLSSAGSLLALLLPSQLPCRKHFPHQVWGHVRKAPGWWPGRPGDGVLRKEQPYPENLHCCHCREAEVGEEQAGCRLEGSQPGLPVLRTLLGLDCDMGAAWSQCPQLIVTSKSSATAPSKTGLTKAEPGVGSGSPKGCRESDRIGTAYPEEGGALFIFLTPVAFPLQARGREGQVERERPSGRK